MIGFMLPGAIVYAGYRPSGLAVFAVVVATASLTTTAYAAGSLTELARLRRFSRLTDARARTMEKAVSPDATADDRKDALLGLLSKVLEVPLVDCSTDRMTSGVVRDAFLLLRPLEEEEPEGEGPLSSA